jgi:undecaprenyl-diphosphatase
MSLIEAIILGIVQGLTEFIPISSSGHLILFRNILGASDGGLAFDVALHAGTLLALLVYFFKDILKLLSAAQRPGPERKLLFCLAISTIPAIFAGVMLQEAAESVFRSAVLVGVNLIVVALIMLYAEHRARNRKLTANLHSIGIKQALLIGGAQALALIPGVSRSGSTITAGLLLGLDRVAATRFSFLMAIPIVFGATAKILLDPSTQTEVVNNSTIFLVGIAVALVSGLLAIRFLLAFLAKHTLKAFAYYRIVLGLVVLAAVL